MTDLKAQPWTPKWGGEQYRPYPAYRDSGFEWPGEIPEHWEAKRLKFSAHLNPGQSPSSEAVSQYPDGLPFLQGNAEFGPVSPSPRLACNEVGTRAQMGDVLLSVRAPVGAVNIADRAYGIGRGLCAIQPSASLEGKFAYYLLISGRDWLQQSATGSTYDAVTVGDVGGIPAVLPPALEQRMIAAFLDRETAKIDGLRVKKERLMELLLERRTSLISNAVTKGLDRKVPTRESGINWLGRVPRHWEVKRLKHLVDYSTGWTPPTGRDSYYGGEHLWANISDLGPRVLRSTEKRISNDAIRDSRLKSVCPGSLLFSFKLSIGIVSIAGVEMYTNEAIAAFPPSEQIHTEYLYWAAPIFVTANAQENIYGARLLNRERISNAPMVLLPAVEQRAIATYLDRETAEIDALVAKIHRAIDRLDELRAALISAAVNGRIDVRQAAG